MEATPVGVEPLAVGTVGCWFAGARRTRQDNCVHPTSIFSRCQISPQKQACGIAQQTLASQPSGACYTVKKQYSCSNGSEMLCHTIHVTSADAVHS